MDYISSKPKTQIYNNNIACELQNIGFLTYEKDCELIRPVGYVWGILGEGNNLRVMRNHEILSVVLILIDIVKHIGSYKYIIDNRFAMTIGDWLTIFHDEMRYRNYVGIMIM